VKARDCKARSIRRADTTALACSATSGYGLLRVDRHLHPLTANSGGFRRGGGVGSVGDKSEDSRCRVIVLPARTPEGAVLIEESARRGVHYKTTSDYGARSKSCPEGCTYTSTTLAARSRCVRSTWPCMPALVSAADINV